MAEETSIGLAELIDQVKRELLSAETGDEATPFFSVDEVKLELKVTVKKEGKGGIRIYVIELGGGASRDDVQTVNVTLTPLISKEERTRLYQERSPAEWAQVQSLAIEGGLKGRRTGSLTDLFPIEPSEA